MVVPRVLEYLLRCFACEFGMNVLLNALLTLTARLLDQNIIPIGRLENNHCVLILKLALVAGQAPPTTPEINNKGPQK